MIEELHEEFVRLIELMSGDGEALWEATVWVLEWFTGLSIAVIAGWIALTVAAYLLPSLIAYWRRHVSRGWLFIFNLVFGWTTIGWFAALAWALLGRAKPRSVPRAELDDGDADFYDADFAEVSAPPARDRASAARD